ncbi:MAG TPA: hypothetical protein H9786_12210 [Candidatus Brachybacterium merdavium]|uniref:Protoporphyrinogen oxidase n=1 Tax=Candidatus Brachybacterium merdavium TaxID=2838513 RepID=A0A9D2RPI9_9MICO|nr:hypothetical protein [Candidatus Brachybacterium merdavium]
MKKFIFLAGLAVGFVLGSRMGRGPYESLERTARQVADDPQVQRRAAQARETAGRVAQDAAETAKEKAPEVASNVQDTVAGAATAAKGRLSSDDGGTGSGNEASADLDAEGSTLKAQSEETANAAGDGEVGEDRPLSS